MAELSTLARPYAKAAFEYARDKQQLAPWSESLATVAAVVEDEKVADALGNPSLTAAQQAALVGDLCGDALSQETRNFIANLAENKRLSLLPQINQLFADYKANFEKSVDVEVVSAFEMAQATVERLAAVLSKKLEREVKVHTSTDKHLLGGILIRAGDLVIDGSVRGRLNKLAEAMNS